MSISRRDTVKIRGAGAVVSGLGPIARPVSALTGRDLSEPDLPNQWAEDKSIEPACISCNPCLMNYGAQSTVCVLNE